MGQDVQTPFTELWNELKMTYEEYIKVMRTTIVRAKVFLQCEIRIKNYMKHYLEFWRANCDMQPSLDPFGMVQYIHCHM